ncbi:MAG: pyridoxal phosphate-dependent aminotransferase [Desulfuromonadales bacterium]|nr:pyridoxal phosphate-dependent aminotransferase [Desulfuromonadales bacterium]
MTPKQKLIPVARRAKAVTPFLAMEVMERAKELEAAGRDVIYLCLGEPDFPTPQPVIDAARRAMEGGETTYTHSLGRLDLRREIAAFYKRRYGVDIDPGQVLVSSGTSPLMLLLFASLLNDGDDVILPDPSYACYPNFIRFVGGEARFLQTRLQDGFQPRADDVLNFMTPKTRALLINSPSNPTGSTLSGDELEALADLPIPVISDEIYHGLTYEGEEHTILEYTSDAFVLGGFSKAYAMTGWRLGYLIAPQQSIRALQTLQQNFLISANNFVQAGGIAALRDCDETVAKMRAAYDERRKHIVPRLRRLGLGIRKMPTGAFYVLADARHISGDSLALSKEILEQTGVAVTAGIDFGAAGEGFLRFSYANSLENIDMAIDRLELFFKEKGWLKA